MFFKERAVELIERMPDSSMSYVVNMLQNMEIQIKELSSGSVHDRNQSMEALHNVFAFCGKIPADFDAERELAEARNEKYDSID